MIYLQGGGACSEEQDCTSRAKTSLGSSSQWAHTRQPKEGSLLSDNCSENPLFCNATMYVPHRSGDTHKGNHTDKSAETWNLYFNGHSSLVQLLRRCRPNTA